MNIILLRHTEVDEAYHKCYNGHINIGLSAKGKAQAATLAKVFEKEEFDLLYCSDLLRTRETLSPFSQEKQAIYTEKLREKSWGKHEGMTYDAIIAEGEIEYESFLQWIEALDGEEYAVYVQRVKQFFLEYLLAKKAETILVVTHAGVIRVLISIVNGISLEEAFALDVSYGAYLVFDTKAMHFSEVKY